MECKGCGKTSLRVDVVPWLQVLPKPKPSFPTIKFRHSNMIVCEECSKIISRLGTIEGKNVDDVSTNIKKMRSVYLHSFGRE